MQQFDIKKPLPHKPLFNPDGDTDVLKRRMIGGNTTNLNDYNNLKYTWASEWYRQAMNNFWIPEEINLSQDIKDYPNLSPAERKAYDKILSFLVFLDSIQTANLPCVGEYITANEVNLCLNIQTFQECVHSQSYSYMLDTICSPDERMDILYQWKTDEHLLKRNTFIGECYNEFQVKKDARTLVKVMMANFVLEGIYFFSGFMFFYNLSRNGKMPGSAQEIRYINRDENTHLWLFRNIIIELRKEHPELFDDHMVSEMKELLMEAVRQEIEWACYVIVLSFIPKVAEIIASMPASIIGGVSFILYGMISAIGVRNVVEAKVDFSKARNTIIAAVILVVALGLTNGITFTVGGHNITLTALAVASIAGIVLNLIFPEKDFDPEKAFQADTVSKQIDVENEQ